MFDGFGLLVGHMLGDYIFQNDWMAANKANQHPGREPHPNQVWLCSHMNGGGNLTDERPNSSELQEQQTWCEARCRYRLGHIACTIHCLLYTLCIWACSFWWMPWWGLVVCFAAHWPIDRFRLAAWWMNNVSGQSFFASKNHPMWPNPIVLVDNTFHLLTLFLIGVISHKIM